MTVINLRQMKRNQTGIITSVKAQGEMGRRIKGHGNCTGKGDHHPGPCAAL